MAHCVCFLLKHQEESHVYEYKVPYGAEKEAVLRERNYSFRCGNQKGFEKGQGLYFTVKM